jgi:hypothetical protein
MLLLVYIYYTYLSVVFMSLLSKLLLDYVYMFSSWYILKIIHALAFLEF